ncbi:DUF523 domain-containing protein [Bacillus sp. SM2101]|uniref:DUF523 domain-containing protein n=1 Tax=Bacillus sp. SM2101 TaxID=2805366 RepID=UPI001BDE3B42|nr:DUF523 domain-containing protein [Bacillus sp. SM2101]
MILVSACLAGNECRYDGNHSLHHVIKDLVVKKKAVAVCPEVLGGLATPREPAEIVGGCGKDVLSGDAKVLSISGQDVTEQFIKGAYDTLKIAKQYKASTVVLKENSPSCGSTHIYNGDFNGMKIAGNGVTAALLESHGFKVVSENNFGELLNQ